MHDTPKKPFTLRRFTRDIQSQPGISGEAMDVVSRTEFDALKLKLERVTEQLGQTTLHLAQLQAIVQALQPPSSPTIRTCSSYSYYKLTPIPQALPIAEQVSDEQALKELQATKGGLDFGPVEAKISETAWLERFLHAAAQDDVPTRNKLLLAFAKDFIRHASTRARIILQEINLPTHKKSILPLHVGGTAGGTKYLDDNILFKFADDPRIDGNQHLYGGSDPDFERAAKAAANELKGANSYFQCLTLFGRLSVIVPPEVLLDFNGFRLIAIPWLPLGSGKLVYGSADQGRIVHDDDPAIRAALKFAAHHLHLAAHRVKNCVLFTAGDVEGHQDMEGRYYLVDLARTFPPEDPTISKHLQQPDSCVFFRFHRAEFMAWLKNKGSSPLSPDAFSMWGQLDAHIHNRQAQLATEELINVRIPEVATWLCSLELVPTNLGKVLQQWGISLRHLGLVRALVRQRSQGQRTQLDLNILTCIVCRCCKNLLRQDLRAAALSRNVNDTIASFLNDLVHRSTEESLSFWTVRIPKDIRSRFGSVAISEEEESKLAQICEQQIPSIAKYVCMRLGISLAHEGQQRFSRDSVLSTSVRAKTFGVLESLLHEDSVEMACESQTSTEFTVAVTRLARMASDELGYLIDHIDDLVKVRQIFSTHCDSLAVKNVNLARIAALALHFRGESLSTADLSDQWLLALAPRLTQIFSPQQLESMMTDRLLCLCREQKTHLPSNVHALVAALVEARADPNARDDEGDPLLFKCIVSGNESMVDSLLECHVSYDGVKDGFGRLLDEVVTSYYLEGTPQYLIRQGLFLKGLVGPPGPKLPPVRLRVHSLLITQLPEGLDISLLRFRVKLRGGGDMAQQKAHMNFSGHAFFVRQEFFFEHWPDVEDMKCVVTHGTDVLATVKLQRPSQVFSSVRARMTAQTPRPSPRSSTTSSCPNTSPASSRSSLSSPSTSCCFSPASSCSSVSSSHRFLPSSISPFTLIADVMYVAPEAKLASLSSSNIAYFHPKHPPQNSILLLGASRSGKTTLFKRLCCVPFSSDQRLYYGDIVRRNVIHGVKGLIQGARTRLFDTLPENVSSIRFVEEIDEHVFDAAEVALHLNNTLNDPGIKKTLTSSPLYSMDKSFAKVARIFAADYVPSDEDIFGCYEPTYMINEGVTEKEWRVSDVGGSKLEQKKWFLLFPHVSSIFFTVNLCSEFEEGDIMNGMAESFALWESVVSHPALSSIPFMLIFTFDSAFRRKLAESALRGQSGSYDDATQSLAKQFVMGLQRVRVFFVDLLDEASCANMLREIEQTLSPGIEQTLSPEIEQASPTQE